MMFSMLRDYLPEMGDVIHIKRNKIGGLEDAKKNQIKMKYFNIKLELKLHNALKKILNEETDIIPECDLTVEDIGVLDPANVCMIIAKTPEAKSVLRRYIYKYREEQKIPNLIYDDTEKQLIMAKYATEYLKNLLIFFDLFEGNNSVDIMIKPDFPMTMENDHFKAILAPRIESD